MIILSSYTAEHGSRVDNPKLGDFTIDNTKSLLVILGSISLVFTFIIMINTCLIKLSINYVLYRDEQAEVTAKHPNSEIYTLGDTAKMMSSKANGIIKLLYNASTEYIVIYYLLLFIANILGLAYHPFFY